MKSPLQIVFRNTDNSPAVEAKVREYAEKLEHFYGDIISCRVAIELGHKHHHQGNLYHVRINLRVPRAELISSHAADERHAHEDVYVAVRDAFHAMRRQLEDYARQRRGKVKHHEPSPHGRIAELRDGYGKIETSDGRQVYFHRNSIVEGDFAKLQVGTEVRFVEVAGEEGPQASTVHLIGKHHIAG